MNEKKVFLGQIFKIKFFSFFYWGLWGSFSVLTYLNFFVFNHFFSSAGSTSLIPYFSFIPFISIIFIPVLCFPHKDSIFDSFLPIKKESRIFLRFTADFLLYAFIFIPSLAVPFIVNHFGDVDFNSFFTSLFLILFFGAAAISVCHLFYNSFSNPVAGLFITTGILALFHFSGQLITTVSLNDFTTRFIELISFSWRINSASKGIFSSSDICFFLLLCISNLLLTFYISEKKDGKIYRSEIKRRFFYIFVGLILIFSISQKFSLSIDFSKDKLFTISPYTKSLVEQSQDTIKISYFYSKTLENQYSDIKNVKELLKTFSKASDKIIYIEQNIDKEPELQKQLAAYGVYPQKIYDNKSANGDYKSVYSAVVLEASGKTEIIPFVLSPNNLEYDFASRILSLLYNRKKTCGILMGNGLSLENHYGYISLWLQNQGFDVFEITSDTLEYYRGPVIVIGENDLSETDCEKIEYAALKNKNPFVFFTTPYSVDLYESWNVFENSKHYLTYMLESMGFYWKNKMLSDSNCNSIIFVNQNQGNDKIKIDYPFWLKTRDSKRELSLFWPIPIEKSELLEPIIYSSSKAVQNSLDFSNKSLIDIDPFSVKMPTDKESNENYLLGAKLNGEVTGLYTGLTETPDSLYVISDQYFLNSLVNEYSGGITGNYSNYEYISYLLTKINGFDELSELQYKNQINTTLYKKRK